MRFLGIGLLLFGTLIAMLAAIAENPGNTVAGLMVAGPIFVAGAVFAAAAGIRDAIVRR